MRVQLTICAAIAALLILPTQAQTQGSASTLTLATNGALAELMEAPSAARVTIAQTTTSGTMPSRGMTMAQVEKSHGAPLVRKAPVGNPPITRWEYEGFVVYFEYRHVIHSVTRVNR